MNAEQMAEVILRLMREKRGVSFIEIIDEIGQEARGRYIWTIAPNTVLWMGMSSTLIKAFKSIGDQIERCRADLLSLFTAPDRAESNRGRFDRRT